MRKITLILAIVMLFSIVPPTLSGCGKVVDMGAKISFLHPGVVRGDLKDSSALAIAEYEKTYKTKVSLIISTWDSYYTKVITQAAAGKPIEVIFAGTGSFPYWYTAGWIQPVNKYVDLKSESIDINAMENLFKYDGKYYLAANKSSYFNFDIFYNENMLNDAGLPLPGDLFKQNKWNYENFLNIAKEMTKQDQNGVTVQWGLATWRTDVFAKTNGCSYLKMGDKGKMSSNLDSPALIKGLEFYREINASGITQYTDSVVAFYKGQAAMLMDSDWMEADLITWQKPWTDGITYVNFDFGIVPLPAGPDNPNRIQQVISTGFVIGSKCRNPVYAGKFIDLLMKIGNEGGVETRSKFRDTTNTMLQDEFAKGFPAESLDNAFWLDDRSLEAELLALVSSSSVSNALETYKDLATYACEVANKGLKIPELPKFIAYKTDFEDSKLGGFLDASDISKQSSAYIVDYGETPSKAISLTAGTEPVDGQVILGVFDGSLIKPSLNGFRDYEMSFKYATDQKTTKNTQLIVAFVSKNDPDMTSLCEYSVKFNEAVNGWYTFSKVFTGMKKNEDCYIVFYGKSGVDSIVIDDLSIKEKDYSEDALN